MDVQELREALGGMNVRAIATDTKLARQTIYTFLKDDAANPTPATVKLLTDWLVLHRKREEAKAKVRRK